MARAGLVDGAANEKFFEPVAKVGGRDPGAVAAEEKSGFAR